MKFPSKIRSFPVGTKQLLTLGILFAFVVALPLFIWAVVTQRFELRKKAQCVIPSAPLLYYTSTSPYAGQYGQGTGYFLQWNESTPNVLNYNVYASTNSEGPFNLYISTAQQFFGPLPNNGYFPLTMPAYFQVKGLSPCGESQESNTVFVPEFGPSPSPSPTPTPLGEWTIKASAICKDTQTVSDHLTRLFAWSGNPSDLKLKQDLENGDTPAQGTHTYSWTPADPYTFICWGMDDGTPTGNLKPVCSTTLGPAACSNNSYCSEGNYSTQRDESLCNQNHSDNANLQEKFCYDGISYEWLSSNQPPNGEYAINFQAPDSWCQANCPNGDKGNLSCDSGAIINTIDLSILLDQWRIGACPAPTPRAGRHSSDLNGDCNINTIDLSRLLNNWKPN